jgi:hypothetical protein
LGRKSWKKTAIIIAALVFGNSVFANQTNQHNAGKLSVLGPLFKSHETTTVIHPDTNKMVYTGEDVSHQAILAGLTVNG